MDIGLISGADVPRAAIDFGLLLAATTADPTLLQTIGGYVWMIVAVAAGLTFVIFVHELGHFLVAKACGVKCEKFYIGFDFFEIPIPFTGWKIPRSLIKFQWGETEYGLGSLPLGGYVKMLGQDDDPRNAETEAARIRAAAAAPTAGEAPAADSKQPPVPARTTEGKTILLDPRSYPAKPVPARMAIISAGVIMNLIFAVILAAIAYRLGVEEMPAIVGGTTPGGAAWTAGIEPGSKIIQFGRQGEPYEALRWHDIRTTAVLHKGEQVSLLVRRPNGEEVWYEVRPRVLAGSKLPLVGIAMPASAQVEIFPEKLGHLNPAASPPLADYDRIIEAAGQQVASGTEFLTICAQQPRGPLAIKVQRGQPSGEGKSARRADSAPQVVDIVLAPRPMRELGLVMRLGPVSAIREGSPAEGAGFLVGDVLVEINGEPIGDPLSLSQRLTPALGSTEPVTLVVERNRKGEAARRTISVVPELPWQSPIRVSTSITSIESIGLAFEVTSEVAQVEPDSPAARAGLAPGDVVTGCEFAWRDVEAARELSRAKRVNLLEPLELAPGKQSWPQVVYAMQMLFPDTKVKLTWTRGGKTMSAELLPRDSATFFDDTRGVSLYPELEPRAAANWREAVALGFREAREQLTQVLTILHRLITRRLSATNLSGPLGIIGVAGAFASEGLASLLLFLTMLSANLAVLNFLPIPALDGGHMLFLTAEWIRGKPVDERLQVRLTVAGVVCLLALMVFATAMDISRFAELIQRWFS